MHKRVPLFLGILLTAIAIWALIYPTPFIHALIDRLENLSYDLALRARVLTEGQVDNNPIAIIDIDDASLEAEGHWPWPRRKLAELTNLLKKQGAAVIVFDILFPEKEPNLAESLSTELNHLNLLAPSLKASLGQVKSYLDWDAVFAKSLADAHAVMAIGFLPRIHQQNQLPAPLFTLTVQESKHLPLIKAIGYISNIPELQQEASKGGFINVFADSDGIIRRAPLVIEYDSALYPSLALQAVLTFHSKSFHLITQRYARDSRIEGVQINNAIIPTDAKTQVLIPFIGKSYTFPFYSATHVLKGNLPIGVLKGKILFIGTSATGLGDLQATSIESPYPGVEIQATLARGLLTHEFSYKPGWEKGALLFLLLFFGLSTTFIFPYLSAWSLSAINLSMILGMLFINHWFWLKTGILLSFILPVSLVFSIAVMNFIYGYLFEARHREQIRKKFGQYVPEKHIDNMLQSKSDYALAGEDRDMSVLFADIRNFTTFSENKTAHELVLLLNAVFTPMTEIIFKYHGTIDKYVGDLIMAFWGAPVKDELHASHAIHCALEMQSKTKILQEEFKQRHWPEITIGIGINSGIMSVGDMGSHYRLNYTVLGDEVNLASRVEGLTKFYHADIIVTQSTQKNQAPFIFQKLDKIKVKGKKMVVEIYEPLCLHTDITPELEEELALYQKALDLYYDQHWKKTEDLFIQLNHRRPNKVLYKLYLNRIHQFQKQPPPSDWDGVFLHLFK